MFSDKAKVGVQGVIVDEDGEEEEDIEEVDLRVEV